MAVPLHALSAAGAEVPVTLADGAPVPLSGLPAGSSALAPDGALRLRVDALPAGVRLLVAAPDALAALAGAAGAWWTAAVLHCVRAGRPFDRRDPTRLAGVAGAVVVGWCGASVLRDVAAMAVLDRLDLVDAGSPFVVSATVPLTGVVVGLAVLGAAEAFRRGAGLTDDVAGLV